MKRGPILDLFYNRRTHELTPLAWSLGGVVILGTGLYAFNANLQAMLEGRQYATSGHGRRMSNQVRSDVGTLLSLAFATGGAMTVWIGFCHAYPALSERRWVQRSAALTFGTLFLLILLLGGFVVVARLFRA